jgi:hypothetical protein
MSNNAPITIVLALGLGGSLTYALSSQDAEGYPATAVSLGTNPVVAKGGALSSSATATPFVVSADHQVTVTDVVLTLYGQSGSVNPCTQRVTIDTSAGTIAEYRLTSDTYYNGYYIQPTTVSHSYNSGLPVAPGDTLSITNHGSACTVSYSLSGYLAQR